MTLLVMDVQLEHPEFLWLLVLVLPVVVFGALRSYAIQPKWLRWTSPILRTLGFAALVLALSRPVWRHESPDQAVVFAVDVSASMDRESLDKALEHIVEATGKLEPDQRAAVVAFAGRAVVLRELTNEPVELGDDESRLLFHRSTLEELKTEIQAVERDLSADGATDRLAKLQGERDSLEQRAEDLRHEETDLREVLRLARSVMPDDARRRVVLFSDGNWTRNDPSAELARLKSTGIQLDVVPIGGAEPKEVIAVRLDAPGQVRVREPVELELFVDAAQAGDVGLELYRDGFLIAKEEAVTLSEGRNTIQVPKQELEEGFHQFEAIIRAPGDPRPENNIARAVVVVQGRPRVLLIEGEEQDARYLEAALHDEDIVVDVRPAIGFPEDLNGLLAFDVLMLSDVPATDLHSSQLALVKQYVKDFGGGLVMLGGEKSFGLGGYYRTAVEDALPVRMPITKTIEKPSFAQVLVLDRSGSMAGEKLQLAKEAAIASAELLKKKDRIGVVCFDSAADWVVDLQSAANRDEIVSQISRITEGGGTYIYSGLYEAYMALSESDAKLKHCIVLSDGHTTGSRDQHIDIVYRMAAEQITVSTVGIGEADQALMAAMADAGAGEAYFTNDFGNVPQIFTKETLRASRSMLVEEPFLPVSTGIDHQMLKGIELADAPILLGYVSTTAKERAQLLLVSDYGDPLLATWSYGLGRSIAFTSDAKNRWAGDWIAWPDFGKFWSQAVRSVMARGTTSPVRQQADIRIDRGEVQMTIDTRDRDGRFLDQVQPVVSVVEASGSTQALGTEHVAPGLVEARFPLPDYGRFVRLRVESQLDGKPVALQRYAVIESYPPEFRSAAIDEVLLERAAEVTAGRVKPEPDTAFAFEGPPARGLEDLWRTLLLIAGLLLPIDIALRRLA